jgi:hypothetical protein
MIFCAIPLPNIIRLPFTAIRNGPFREFPSTSISTPGTSPMADNLPWSPWHDSTETNLTRLPTCTITNGIAITFRPDVSVIYRASISIPAASSFRRER